MPGGIDVSSGSLPEEGTFQKKVSATDFGGSGTFQKQAPFPVVRGTYLQTGDRLCKVPAQSNSFQGVCRSSTQTPTSPGAESSRRPLLPNCPSSFPARTRPRGFRPSLFSVRAILAAEKPSAASARIRSMMACSPGNDAVRPRPGGLAALAVCPAVDEGSLVLREDAE